MCVCACACVRECMCVCVIFILCHSTGKGDVTIKIKDNDFMDMVAGKLTPQKVCNRHLRKPILLTVAVYVEFFSSSII